MQKGESIQKQIIAELPTQSFEIATLLEQKNKIEEQLKSALQDVAKSELHFKTVIESLPQIVWTATPDVSPDFYNQNWVDYTGMTVEQTTGWGWTPVLHPEDISIAVERWTHSFQTGASYEVEYRFKRASDGAYRWHLGRALPMRDAEGKIVKWFGTCTDIDDQKRATERERTLINEKLSQLESFRVLAEAIPNLAWIAHPDGFIFWYNQRWYDYTGTAPKDMEGWGWTVVHDPAMLPSVLERWQASVQSGEPFEMEFPLKGADGIFRWFLTRVTPVRNADNSIVNWFGTNTDIDDQIKAKDRLEARVLERTAELSLVNSALEQKNRELANSNHELEDFAYIASHDLKEPLRGIGNYATFLLEDYHDKLDDTGKDMLKTLPRLVSNLENLIDSLLYYSKVGQLDLAVRETNLAQVVDKVLDTLQISIREKNAEVLGSTSLPIVVCDQSRVAEIFRNLITNAMKYTDQSKVQIELGIMPATIPGSTPVFFVRDDGIGIREEHLSSIFRIFKRLHGKDRYGGGTGVGLTVAKKIVERHGGRIWVESVYGSGSTFYFTLAPMKVVV